MRTQPECRASAHAYSINLDIACLSVAVIGWSG